MTTVAFPSLNLDRETTFQHDNLTRVDRVTDGSARSRVLSTTQYVSIKCVFKYLDSDDKATLETFLKENRANTITWTIDSVNYSGVIDGGHSVSMVGPLFNISFTYYASEV